MSKFQLETDGTRCVVTWTQFTYPLFFASLFFVLGAWTLCGLFISFGFSEGFNPYAETEVLLFQYFLFFLLLPAILAVSLLVSLFFIDLVFGTTRIELNPDGLTSQTSFFWFIKRTHQIQLADIDYFELFERHWFIDMLLLNEGDSYYSIRAVLRKRMRVFFWIRKKVDFTIPHQEGFETLDVQLNDLLRELQKKHPASK